MPSVVDDFSFIARRVKEIRTARYNELGVSPPASSGQLQPSVQQATPTPTNCGGFKYAPGFEPQTAKSPVIDDWDCCLPPA
jgi:hypothetical protein